MITKRRWQWHHRSRAFTKRKTLPHLRDSFGGNLKRAKDRDEDKRKAKSRKTQHKTDN